MAASELFLGLNRESLRRERFSTFEVIALCKEIVDSDDERLREFALLQVRNLQAPTQPFAGMHRWFAKQWDLPGPD